MKQYQKLFELEKVKLSFTKEALRAIGARGACGASRARAGCAPSSKHAMLDIMYDVPYREGVKECRITDGVILKKEPPLLTFEKEKKLA